MRILDALRRRAPAGSPDAGYDELDSHQACARLQGLSQADLVSAESYEREHLNRGVVLDKLRYLRTSEPLPGYDELSPEQIAEALSTADATTVKDVRDYERKFRNRANVMEV